MKGSELNYSLQRIERVLETNRFIYLKKLPERLNGQPDSSPTISKLVNKHQVPKPDDGLVHGRLNQIENSLVDELVKDLSVTVTQLTKPEEHLELPPINLIQRKKRRKRKGLRY